MRLSWKCLVLISAAAIVPWMVACTTSEQSGVQVNQHNQPIDPPLNPSESVNAKTYFALAHLLERQGNFERAAGQYQEALRLAPDYVDAQNRLAITLNKLGRHNEASAVFRRAADAHPDAAHLRNNLAFSLILEGRYAEAEAEASRAIKIRPRFARAHMNRGMALAKMHQYDAAFEEFSFVGGRADAFYNLGLMQADGGDYTKAVVSLNRALQANPNLKVAQDQLDRLKLLASQQAERFGDAAATPTTPSRDNRMVSRTPTPRPQTQQPKPQPQPTNNGVVIEDHGYLPPGIWPAPGSATGHATPNNTTPTTPPARSPGAAAPSSTGVKQGTTRNSTQTERGSAQSSNSETEILSVQPIFSDKPSTGGSNTPRTGKTDDAAGEGNSQGATPPDKSDDSTSDTAKDSTTTARAGGLDTWYDLDGASDVVQVADVQQVAVLEPIDAPGCDAKHEPVALARHASTAAIDADCPPVSETAELTALSMLIERLNTSSASSAELESAIERWFDEWFQGVEMNSLATP
jgi:Tfp pilus assembly protein PilF